MLGHREIDVDDVPAPPLAGHFRKTTLERDSDRLPVDDERRSGDVGLLEPIAIAPRQQTARPCRNPDGEREDGAFIRLDAQLDLSVPRVVGALRYANAGFGDIYPLLLCAKEIHEQRRAGGCVGELRWRSCASGVVNQDFGEVERTRVTRGREKRVQPRQHERQPHCP